MVNRLCEMLQSCLCMKLPMVVCEILLSCPWLCVKLPMVVCEMLQSCPCRVVCELNASEVVCELNASELPMVVCETLQSPCECCLWLCVKR
jgi:hypothetical protein